MSQNGQHDSRPAAAGLISSTRDVMGDIADLTSLQMRLLAADAKEASHRLKGPAIAIAVGLVGVLGCVTAIVLGAGYLLHEASGLPVSASLLIAGVAGAALLGLLVWRGATGLGKALGAFSRSTGELERNWSWLTDVLRRRTQVARDPYETTKPR